MPILSSFSTPALIQDLANHPDLQNELNALWNNNVQAFTQQAIFGDPWNTTNASNQTSYYNPTTTNVPTGASAAAIAWVPFPNRLVYYAGPPQTAPPNPENLSSIALNQA